MKIKTAVIFVLLTVIALASYSQNITEIHYHNSQYHVPNSVCQSKDGNILVQCDIKQNNEKIGSKLLKYNKQGDCLDSLLINDEAEVWAFINAKLWARAISWLR